MPSNKTETMTDSLASSSSELQQIVLNHPQAALDFAAFFQGQGRTADALALCDALLESVPAQAEAAALLAVRLLWEAGETEKALRRLLDMERRGMGGETVAAEVSRRILAAVEVYEALRAKGEIDQALKICDALVDLRPGKSLLLRARWELRELATYDGLKATYDGLLALVEAYYQERNFEAELTARLDVHRHPIDRRLRRNVDRVNNLSCAIGRLLGADLDHVGEERIAQVRDLLVEIDKIPAHSMADARTDDEIYAARFDRWYRMLLNTLDLDMVFGPPLPPGERLPTLFALADGTPAQMEEIAAQARAQGARVAFCAATSPEYFQRYAEAYVRTTLQKVDCDAMICVLLCCPFERFAEVIADFPIQSPRLFFACDGYDSRIASERTVLATQVEPIIGTHLYAVSGLLRLDHLLDHLEIPVFITGIDTVLQYGVADLLDKHQGCDVVLNKIGSHFGLGGQIVNNLSLTFPTPVGGAFVRFLQAYTGKHLRDVMQPAFLDQLDLHMAKHHVGRIEGSRLGFFGEFDINNLMFDNSMVEASRDFIHRYRFVNIFASMGAEKAIDPDDL